MNETDKFALLERTEKAMTPAQQDSYELTMLRAFFDAWEALHAIKGDKRNPEIRAQYEQAAQTLVDAAHPLRILRKEHAH